MKKFLILICALFYWVAADAQEDTSHTLHLRDSFYWIVENPVKYPLLGNAWYMAGAYTLARTSEVDVNIGRSLVASTCGGAGCMYAMNSVGLGYGRTWKNGEHKDLVKAFAEFSFFYVPPLAFTFRPEYMYNITNQQHYLRPAAGLNLFYADVLYSYAIKLNGKENDFRHGLTLRVKYFTHKKKWLRRIPSRC